MNKDIKAVLNGNTLELKNIEMIQHPEFADYSEYALSAPAFKAEVFYNGKKAADASHDGFGLDIDIEYTADADMAGIGKFVDDASHITCSSRVKEDGGYVEDNYDSIGYIILSMVNEGQENFKFNN